MPTRRPRRLRTAVLVTVLGLLAALVAPAVASAQDPSGDLSPTDSSGVESTGPSSTTTSTTTAPTGQVNPNASAGDGDYQVLREDYDKVLAEEAVKLRQLADTVQKRQGVELEVLSLDTQIKTTQAKLDVAQAALVKANDVRAQTLAELEKAQAAVAAAKSELKQQVLSNYVLGGQGGSDPLGSVLDENQQDDGQTVTYAKVVVQHQNDVIGEYNAAKAERDRQAKAAAAAESNARASRDSVAAFKSSLEGHRADRKTAAQDLAVEQFNETAQFNLLDKSKADIVAKVVGLAQDGDGITSMVNAAQVGQPPFVFPAKGLINPTPGAAYTQSFGPQKAPVLGVQGSHPGIDLAGPAGADVHASADGVVIVAGPLGGYGNAVIIDHGNHLATLYGHNQDVVVKVGDKVKQNDVISHRGSTGFSTGPHVHFETRVNGVPVDPLLFIRL